MEPEISENQNSISKNMDNNDDLSENNKVYMVDEKLSRGTTPVLT
jgi:hypothetical protein